MAKHPSTLPAPSKTDALANGVLEGMRKHPRQLSPVWFYDELGSFLFDSICELPEYYLTRTERQIMREHAPDMAHHIGPDAAIKGSILGRNCHVGRSASIESPAVLGDKTVITDYSKI